jgi:hypothetical protein
MTKEQEKRLLESQQSILWFKQDVCINVALKLAEKLPEYSGIGCNYRWEHIAETLTRAKEYIQAKPPIDKIVEDYDA